MYVRSIYGKKIIVGHFGKRKRKYFFCHKIDIFEKNKWHIALDFYLSMGKSLLSLFFKKMFTYQLHGIFSFCNFFVFKMTHCDKNEEKQT